MPIKVSSKPSQAALDYAKNHQVPVSTDKLQMITDAAAKLRDLEFEISDLEGRLSELKTRKNTLEHVTLPDLMMDAKVRQLTIPADGNMPERKLTLKPYYSANIAVAWSADKRQEAFAYLESIGAGDLIKVNVELAFPRGAKDQAAKMLAKLQGQKSLKASVSLKESVHSATLTAWLKEQTEVHQKIPDLSKIGGAVGQVVEMKG